MIIYKITNIINNKCYIGQTINTRDRKAEHFRKLRKNIHHNIHLQRSFNKYGEDNFKFEIIDNANNIDDLNEKEIYWIEKYNSLNKKKGFNLNTGGKNHRLSEETKKKIAEKNKGKEGLKGKDNPMYGTSYFEIWKEKYGEEEAIKRKRKTIEKCKLSSKGRIITESTKKKISKARQGKTISDETKKKISESQKGRKHFKESIQKMSLNKIGKKRNPFSEQWKKNIGNSVRGEKAGLAKLTDKKVLKIKKLLIKEELKLKEIAELFNVSESTISSIKNNRTWSHVKWNQN